MQLALKIDVATLVGARLGVPPLLELLKRYDAGATFFFNLGRDETRSVVRSVFRGGLRKKIKQLSITANNPFTVFSSCYWLPATRLMAPCSEVLRQVIAAGFEVGIHSYDPVAWHGVCLGARKKAVHTLTLSYQRFQEVTGAAPRCHSSGGWRMNHHAFRITQGLGLTFSSDSRGTSPYIPILNAEIIACAQLPTTLPTLDEVIRAGASSADDAVSRITTSENDCRIYTARAELEGIALLSVFENLLSKWRELGYEIVSLNKYLADYDKSHMPRYSVALKKIAGLEMTAQGRDFLADLDIKDDIYPIDKDQLSKIRDLTQLQI